MMAENTGPDAVAKMAERVKQIIRDRAKGK